MDLSSPNIFIHGVLVNIAGVGVLITGESGVGKSECALELISKGHKLVADDVVEIQKVDNKLVGRPPTRLAGLLEIRGLGIFDIRQMFTVDAFEPQHPIDVCVEFRNEKGAEETDRINRRATEFESLGLQIPKFILSFDSFRNRTLLVETVVKLRKLVVAPIDADLAKAHDSFISVANS